MHVGEGGDAAVHGHPGQLADPVDQSQVLALVSPGQPDRDRQAGLRLGLGPRFVEGSLVSEMYVKRERAGMVELAIDTTLRDIYD